ncbi:LuxR C-terminal-related transcriptional regulator [Metapseudomonas resinovorans]|uniref:Putative LuxR family transcriptional regulator n=1 Tax=Metapseudomonas resinovorans NBRC 106553 TaxID=1245471 RepID=S6AF23_METRE|nr:LuxR C-terminal-related transcriptional regulator [Pseudomonas resinovorans]BAN48442.1 putative LuxR family transcriptional regulator [Pseudomonas resinovorans NBRC 106553]
MASSFPPPHRDAVSFRLPPDHLVRPRLRDSLLQADCRLRLLCAPAGSGKSVLLKECLQQRPASCRAVFLELNGKRLGRQDLLERLAVALEAPDASWAGVCQQLAMVSGGLWVVLDDYPRFPDRELDELLNDLIQSSPRHVAWWIASRRRPELQLARLLLDGDLFELGAGELAFDLQELVMLLAGRWPRDAIDHLHRDTRGWCAGIRLHLLSQGPTGGSVAFDPDHPLVLGYLRSEVLDELPEDWRQALFTLALLPQFDAALCEQLLGAGEGARLLEQLVNCGLFIEPAGEGGYSFQMQPVQARVLAGQLPEPMVKAVFRRACQWYLGQDKVRQALEYSVKAGQMDVAASLMQRYSNDLLLQGRSLMELMNLRRELPAELLTSTPRLTVLNAWTLMLSGRLDEAEAYTERLGDFLPQGDVRRQHELVAQWKALHGNLAFHRGQPERARELLAEALAELSSRSWGQRLFSRALQVEQALIDGRLDEAAELNRAATKEARQHASLAMEAVLVLGHVKLLEIRGELLRAETLLKRLYSELTQAWDNEPSPMRGRVQLRRAMLLTQQGRYPEAAREFQSGQQEALDCGDPAAFWGYLGLAELDALQGDPDAAYQRIADAERFMHFSHVDEALYRGHLLRARARLWLSQGRAAQADKVLRSMPASMLNTSPYGAPELHLGLRLLQLQARLAVGDLDQALPELTALHARALAEGRRVVACEVGFSLVEGLYASNKPGQAKQLLLDTLALARQLGLASAERAFALRSPALMRWAGDASRGDGEPVALLTRREMEVLKLVAQGLANQQIAEALFISLHTVKTHAQRINFKLGVERRTQALVRAKELGLV